MCFCFFFCTNGGVTSFGTATRWNHHLIRWTLLTGRVTVPIRSVTVGAYGSRGSVAGPARCRRGSCGPPQSEKAQQIGWSPSQLGLFRIGCEPAQFSSWGIGSLRPGVARTISALRRISEFFNLIVELGSWQLRPTAADMKSFGRLQAVHWRRRGPRRPRRRRGTRHVVCGVLSPSHGGRGAEARSGEGQRPGPQHEVQIQKYRSLNENHNESV